MRAEPLLRAAETLDFLPGFTSLPAETAAQLFPSIRNRGRTEQWQGWWGMQRELMPLAGGAAQLATGIDLRQERWTSHPDALLSQGDLALGLPQEQRHLSRRSGGAYAELGLPWRARCAWTWPHAGTATATTRPSPRVGVRWSPTPRWSFLLASGRGYRAPACSNNGGPGLLRCDRAAGLQRTARLRAEQRQRRCSVTVDVVENDALKAERSRSHSLGATWTPTDTFSLSLTHNIVELRNEILALQPADAVWNRSTWELDEEDACTTCACPSTTSAVPRRATLYCVGNTTSTPAAPASGCSRSMH